MKRLLITLLALILFVSCTGNTIFKKPKNLIPRDSMILLLTDMHIAAVAKGTTNKFYKKGVNYMHFIYEKYKIDSTRFENSNRYYTSVIDTYDELLNEVKLNLQQKEVVVQNEINASDSITKARKKEVKLEMDSLLEKRYKKEFKNFRQEQKKER